MHATICDLITDLVQNSIEADATEITLKVEEAGTNLRVEIADNGKGMSADTIRRAKDPFYSDGSKHRHRKVGLGLPFLFQTAEMTRGTAQIESEEGIGTRVTFSLDRENVDLPDFGSFASTVTALMAFEFEGNLSVEHRRNGRGYTASRLELQDALGDLNDLEGLTLLKQFMESNEEEING